MLKAIFRLGPDNAVQIGVLLKRLTWKEPTFGQEDAISTDRSRNYTPKCAFIQAALVNAQVNPGNNFVTTVREAWQALDASLTRGRNRHASKLPWLHLGCLLIVDIDHPRTVNKHCQRREPNPARLKLTLDVGAQRIRRD